MFNSTKRSIPPFLVFALILCLGNSDATAQSLKSAPSTFDLIDLLKNPQAVPAPRTTFPGLDPLPELGVHSLYTNTITGQALLMDAPPYGISYDIPATGIIPFDGGGAPKRALDVPLNEFDFIVDRVAVVQLGKALFWDMQVGSDSVQACASCHFHAGADDRITNQLNPGTIAGDTTLQVRGPNQTLDSEDFPFHKIADITIPGEPMMNPANVVSDANDVCSSMGVRFRQFVDIPTPGAGAFIAGTMPPVLKPDIGNDVPDPVGAAFQGFRRVEPRNTPTFFGAASNFDNFWDARARHDFNGGSPHGASDPDSHIFEDNGGGLVATRQMIRFSSMASLATGPALSNFEMSFDGRSWVKIAKKLLQVGVVPLANQLVSTTDSVLGPFSNQNATPGMPGLNISYGALIEMAFGSRLWMNTTEHLESTVDAGDPFDGVSLGIVGGAAVATDTNQFTHKEANFSLFFGLSVQAFTQILLPDDSPFDQFHDANPDEFLGLVTDIEPGTPGIQVVGLTDRQLFGYDIFQGSNLSQLNPMNKNASCNVCHIGPNMTEHSLLEILGFFPADLITGEDKNLAGFLLENALNGNAQITMELDELNQSLDPLGISDGIALVDKGIYNIGVRPSGEDIARGADDAFGFPLSLSALALQNAGFPVGAFSDPMNPIAPLPGFLAPFVNEFPIGADFPFIGVPLFLTDTISLTPTIVLEPTGTHPTPNRIARMGNFKVPSLKGVELTGPYFHNGGMLTLRQVVDFYARGGDFPVTNRADRDPLIVDLRVNNDTLLTEADLVALTDFLLSLTDERVKFKRAPFDHPEIIVPIDGTAPDNTAGRAALLADSRFRVVDAVGAGGLGAPVPNFLGVSSVEGSPGVDHFDSFSFFVPVAGAPTMNIPTPGVAGSINRLSTSGTTSGGLVGYFVGSTLGVSTLTVPICPGGILMGIVDPFLLGVSSTFAGTSFLFRTPPPSAAGLTVHLQVVDAATCTASNIVTHTF